ncbi:MAG: hypothetical protein WCI47_01305 [bacterium]
MTHTKIVPAVLETDMRSYRSKVAQIRQLTNRFQLDIIDGEFADNKTIQLQDIEPPSGLKLDIHLMVARPMEYISNAIKLRPYTVIVQFESESGVQEAIEKIKSGGIRSGVAINPDTTVEEIRPLLELVSHVLIMAYPAGFAGQKLQPSVFKKVAEIRDINPDIEIGLDGGVDATTLSKIAKAGFDVICTNTYLFEAESVLTRYHELIGGLS